MSWDSNSNLICDWCYKVVIPVNKVTDQDKECNTGWTKCNKCCEKATPYPKEGRIEDLPDDFFAPKDPAKQFIEKHRDQTSLLICKDGECKHEEHIDTFVAIGICGDKTGKNL